MHPTRRCISLPSTCVRRGSTPNYYVRIRRPSPSVEFQEPLWPRFVGHPAAPLKRPTDRLRSSVRFWLLCLAENMTSRSGGTRVGKRIACDFLTRRGSAQGSQWRTRWSFGKDARLPKVLGVQLRLFVKRCDCLIRWSDMTGARHHPCGFACRHFPTRVQRLASGFVMHATPLLGKIAPPEDLPKAFVFAKCGGCHQKWAGGSGRLCSSHSSRSRAIWSWSCATERIARPRFMNADLRSTSAFARPSLRWTDGSTLKRQHSQHSMIQTGQDHRASIYDLRGQMRPR